MMAIGFCCSVRARSLCRAFGRLRFCLSAKYAQRRVVTGSGDNSARVWDLPGATPVTAVLEGHRGAVGSLAFSPDGKRVVTGSADSSARVWVTPPLEELIPLAGAALTRCLTIAQRDELGLPIPPGVGQDRERIDPPPCP